MGFPPPSTTRDTISEGAAEVKAKLREDISRWTKTRRLVSLKPEISCLECDGAGKILCAVCQGAGLSKLVMEDGTRDPCAKCGGSGSITCVTCAGRGVVANVYRKPVLWVLVVGGLAWLIILFQLWGRDVLPEQRARVLQRGEHGKTVGLRSGNGPASGSPQIARPPTNAMPQQYPQGGSMPQPPVSAPPVPMGGQHGNAVQPGYGSPPLRTGQPQGGFAQPFGGGQSVPGPR